MGIRSLSTASISTGTKRSKVWDQSAVYLPTSYESIATQTVGAGGATSVTFSSIPSTYTHLQVRLIAKELAAPNFYDSLIMRVNSDSATNYSYHYLEGYNATTGSSGVINTGFIQFYSIGGNAGANIFGAQIIDLLDYKNTNKFKTIREIGGVSGNTAGGSVYVGSANWRSTSAINSITFSTSSGFSQYSHFALYGIKG